MTSFTTTPVDAESAAALEANGLRLGLVDTADGDAFTAWLRADFRGFHQSDPSDELLAAHREALAYRRTTGVWDATANDAVTPVATVSSWRARMTVPGPREVHAWAISAVTVAPTHRRRGIARNLLESELRTAASLGMPLATLTVSESTIYGRFGFAPATFATDLRIDVRRTRWVGPAAPGRLHFVTIPETRAALEELHERILVTGVGQIDSWDGRWDRVAGLFPDDAERAKALRAVRYDDPDGRMRGLALYRVTGGTDFVGHTATVEYLSSETDDAYAALWRYIVELDLVDTVTAHDRQVDEPLLWQVDDMRAVTLKPYDHVWTRILDVPAALSARDYAAPLETVVQVTDELGFAAGTYALSIDGTATVERTDAPAALVMSVNELSALYLGGVSASTLVAAGRIEEREPGAASALDTAFRSSRPPWLSFWF